MALTFSRDRVETAFHFVSTTARQDYSVETVIQTVPRALFENR